MIYNRTEITACLGDPIGSWDVSLISDFSQLFCGHTFYAHLCADDGVRGTFNESINDWNMAGATTLESIFYLNQARMHNMDQKATVIWPGPEMRQILCACPRVF